MTDYELKDFVEDLDDLLIKVEASFNIKFIDDELMHISTFGELCDLIASKMQLENLEDCTSQQAFYKLRNAISLTLEIEKDLISPDYPLEKLLPRKNRRSSTKRIELYLGFKLNILRPPHLISWILIVGFLLSFIVIFINWQIGLLSIVIAVGGLRIANNIGNELDLKTVGQVAEKMTRENYLKSRRNPNSVNKKEIEKVLIDWFSNYFDLDKSKLTRDAKFV